MAITNSITLEADYDSFINEKVASGKFKSASDVIQKALKLLKEEEFKNDIIRKALIKGEESGFVENFNAEENLKQLHKKYAK